jgi:hypothetical protein
MMRRSIAFLGLVLVAACGGSDSPSGDGVGGATPNNNTFETATPITLNTQVTASMPSALDVDYFSFTVPTGGRTVRIQAFDSTGTACSSPDTSVILFNSSRTAIGNADTGGACPDRTWTLPAGSYFIQVQLLYPGTGTYIVKTTIV